MDWCECGWYVFLFLFCIEYCILFCVARFLFVIADVPVFYMVCNVVSTLCCSSVESHSITTGHFGVISKSHIKNNCCILNTVSDIFFLFFEHVHVTKESPIATRPNVLLSLSPVQ